mmetsp:Transcript_2684/g.10309  ORF Transcript_2684/g.10309 Transcript_2684/m.10309 type:complete len:285 (+) Transcript_2684:2172-3026(+)
MIVIAASPTAVMVSAANTNGNKAPNKSPPITNESSTFTDEMPAALVYAFINANEVSTALPMANPFPVAAVVFPSASKASVRSRTSGGNSDISARPPALSATGPYASVAKVTPKVLSIPTAAIAIPYTPAGPTLASYFCPAKSPNRTHNTMLTTIITTGAIAESIPTDNPRITTVAGPVTPLCAIDFVGLYAKLVAYSVNNPINTPAPNPITKHKNNGHASGCGSNKRKTINPPISTLRKAAAKIPRRIAHKSILCTSSSLAPLFSLVLTNDEPMILHNTPPAAK